MAHLPRQLPYLCHPHYALRAFPLTSVMTPSLFVIHPITRLVMQYFGVDLPEKMTAQELGNLWCRKPYVERSVEDIFTRAFYRCCQPYPEKAFEENTLIRVSEEQFTKLPNAQSRRHSWQAHNEADICLFSESTFLENYVTNFSRTEVFFSSACEAFTPLCYQYLMDYQRAFPKMPIHFIDNVTRVLGDGGVARVYAMNKYLVARVIRKKGETIDADLKKVIETALIIRNVPESPYINGFRGLVYIKTQKRWGHAFQRIEGCDLCSVSTPPMVMLRFFKEIAIGHKILDEAGVPHCDLNGGNVMISQERAILIDYFPNYVSDNTRLNSRNKFDQVFEFTFKQRIVCDHSLPMEPTWGTSGALLSYVGWDEIIQKL